LTIHPKTVIIIAGPTAVGKTSLAIQLAQHFGTQIISADSRQCFTEMSIGTAKPSREDLNLVHHYFINSHSIHDEVNAVTFEQYALQTANTIFATNNIAIMVGGTGLYIKAFCEGMDPIPAIPNDIRQNIIQQYQQQGLQWLQNEVAIRDPLFWEIAEQQNPQRLMRALEVVEATGNSINIYRNKTKVERPFNVIKIGLELSKEQLHHNINTRVDAMIEMGLLNEVKSLLNYQHLNALQTVGYKELFEDLKGLSTLPKAIEQIKINTRHYAKRQMTWFKKDEQIQWFQANKTAFQQVLSTLNL
jgi:tRNA dimethylallyltransferase